MSTRLDQQLALEAVVSSSELTPCKTTCLLDKTHSYCEECGRSTTDIQNWLSYPKEKRKEIMKDLKAKRKK